MEEFLFYIIFGHPVSRIIVGLLMVIGGIYLWLTNEFLARWALALLIAGGLLLIGFSIRSIYRKKKQPQGYQQPSTQENRQ